MKTKHTEWMELLDAQDGHTRLMLASAQPRWRTTRIAKEHLLVKDDLFAEEEGAFWHWVKKWLPKETRRDAHVEILQLGGGRELFHREYAGQVDCLLADDGESFVVFHDGEAAETIVECWDVSPPNPLRRIVGIPLGLGVALISLRAGWRRLRRRPAPEFLAPR